MAASSEAKINIKNLRDLMQQLSDEFNPEEKLMILLGQLSDEFKRNKPAEKGDKGRYYAIAITELEKLTGFWYLWGVKGPALPREDYEPVESGEGA